MRLRLDTYIPAKFPSTVEIFKKFQPSNSFSVKRNESGCSNSPASSSLSAKRPPASGTKFITTAKMDGNSNSLKMNPDYPQRPSSTPANLNMYRYPATSEPSISHAPEAGVPQGWEQELPEVSISSASIRPRLTCKTAPDTPCTGMEA